jgi:tetratricopeptide (TPR) repeat protein
MALPDRMPMSDSPKAVFLSYASQDADAARRICEVLRAAGLEVWFDQSELRGGDAWDASIRRQIKECALFIPIISANTESRTEGYFRLEWRLAEQRSHLMAKGRPFLVPIVIDATSDTQAHVPDAFLEVQWSRLPEGRCDRQFAARIQQLLSAEATRSKGAGAAAGTAAAPAPRRFPRWLFWIIVPVLINVVGIVVVKLLRQAPPSTPHDRAAPSVGSAVELATKARALLRGTAAPAAELVAKARALLDDDPLMTRRNVELAEQFALEAIAKDPSSAEAFAAAAWANYHFIQSNYEDTPKRRSDLRSHAEKAKLLDPESANAELAACGLLVVNRDWAEASRRLDKLIARVPTNITVLREAAWAADRSAPAAEGAPVGGKADLLDRLRAVSPLGRSYADSHLAAMHWRRGNYVEADRLLDGVFASGQPVRWSYLLRLLVLEYGWGDLAAAREFVATIPSKLLLEDVFIAHVSWLWLRSGEYEKALETLGRSQRDMLQEALVEIPTAELRGNVHAAAGRPAAAELQWREAIKTYDRLLAAKPDSGLLREGKATVLALLGERKAAAAEFALSRELNKNPSAGTIAWALSYGYHLAAGDREAAIVRLDRLVQRDYGRWPNVYTRLRDDPFLRSVHADPRVKAMLQRGARWLAEMRASRKP